MRVLSGLEGYRVKIVDGNCLAASEHRLKALREATGRALPGKSLVVYEPAPGLVADVFLCEDGHAQERSLLGAVLATVAADDLCIADRNFCTRAFLCEMDTRGGFFAIRQHQGLPFEIVSPLRSDERTPTGSLAQQRVCVVDEHGTKHVWRRLAAQIGSRDTKWSHPAPHPDQSPAPDTGATGGTALPESWDIRDRLPTFRSVFSLSKPHTFGYPKAALFGFSVALVAYNVLAVVLAALRSVHGEATVEHEVSLYYIANQLATTYTGMMIAIPEPEWAIFYAMHTPDLAAILRELAQRVRLQALRKSRQSSREPGQTSRHTKEGTRFHGEITPKSQGTVGRTLTWVGKEPPGALCRRPLQRLFLASRLMRATLHN